LAGVKLGYLCGPLVPPDPIHTIDLDNRAGDFCRNGSCRSEKSRHSFRCPPQCGETVMDIRLFDARLSAARCTILPSESNNLIWEHRALT
jgi:hypothetical protein